MRNQKIVENIVNQLLHQEGKFIEDQLPTHVEDQLANAGKTVDKIPISISDQISLQNGIMGGEFNIEIKKAMRHLHYKIEANKSKTKVFCSLTHPFFSRASIRLMRRRVAEKAREARKNSSSIQTMYIAKDGCNFVISSLLSIKKMTKKELREKISILLEEVEKFWPFKY